MSFDWGAYEPLKSEHFVSAELPRREARRLYRELMSAKGSRIDGLRRLMAANACALDSTDEGLDALNEWFIANLEAEPGSPGVPSYEWASVVWDVGLFLGDCLIERFPRLQWEFETGGGRRFRAFQSPVVSGFPPSGPYNPSFTVIQRTENYAGDILYRRAGEPQLGVVTVHGTQVDLDDVLSRFEALPLSRREFLSWMQVAARRNNVTPAHPELLP